MTDEVSAAADAGAAVDCATQRGLAAFLDCDTGVVVQRLVFMLGANYSSF